MSRPAFIALSCVGFIATAPGHAGEILVGAGAESLLAGTGTDADPVGEQVVVTADRRPTLAGPKATQPLRDTPQTVTVISDQTLRKQNLLTLRDALAVAPGITFGAGEGGGGYGDSINLRGYSANTDITIDGVRDSAQYSRTDPFNLQQIEVYNGANSVFAGAGSVGGTINLVSKAPRAEDLTIVQAAVGTDRYRRLAVDTNQRIGQFAAVRLNAMAHRNAYPGRAVETFERWGVAPAVTLGIGGPTSLTLAYLHQRDDNVPLYGVPWFRGPVNDGRVPGISDRDYFGYRNLDRQRTTVDRLTATFAHAMSATINIRNLTRWQRVKQDSVTSAPQGTFCLTATGRQPVGATPTDTVGLPCITSTAPIVTVPAGTFLPSGPRGLVRDQANDLFSNQTDFSWTTGEQGRVRNILNIGVQAGIEDYAIATGSLLRTATGVAVAPLPFIELTRPDAVYAGPLNYVTTAVSRSSARNLAVYAFDTLELGKLELNGGVRWERVRQIFRAVPLAAPPPGTAPLTPLQALPQVSDDTLISYRLGVVYKPTQTVSLYAAFGNARTPSSATVRLGCGVLTVPGGADPCAVAPETARNYEVGAKADIGGLALTAAAFRNERSNFRTPSNDPSQPAALQVLDGRSRVDGIALGATGSPVKRLTLFANYTYLDGRVLQSVSDFCLANGGAAGCANTAAVPDPQRGQRLLQTPRHAGSLFASYRFARGFELGYGLTYQGRFALNNRVAPSVAATNLTQYFSDAWMTQRLFASYELRTGVTLQLNVQNLFDTHYYTNIRNNVSTTTGAITGGWALPGERRSAVLSLFASF